MPCRGSSVCQDVDLGHFSRKAARGSGGGSGGGGWRGMTKTRS